MEFGRRAESYEEHAYVQRDLVQWGRELYKHVTGDVLELGAGTGFLTRELVKQGCHVDATDISEGMVSVGSRQVPQANWRIEDAWKPKTERQYDWVVSASLLHWAKDPVKALQQWQKRLKPGGRILCLLYTEGTLGEIGEMGPVSWRSTTGWQKIFREAGMKVERELDECVSYEYKSLVELLRYIQRTGMYCKNRLSRERVIGVIKEHRGLGMRVPWKFYGVKL